MAVSCHSCNYLDIVPDENATEADAFKNISAAEKFLYSCYAYMKKPSDTSTAVDLLTGDDVVTALSCFAGSASIGDDEALLS